jgi:hypothetical protein
MPKKDNHAKDVARRKKVADEARRREHHRQAREFPEFVMVPNEAPAEFVEAVRAATRTIDFHNTADFKLWEATHYRRIKQAGTAKLNIEVRISKEQAKAEGFDRGQYVIEQQIYFATNLGEVIFRRIPRDVLLRYVPYNDVSFLPGPQIQAIFRSLKRAKGPGGTIYYSRHKPKLTIGGRDLTVAFSGHAIRRMADRLSHNWPNYAGLGDLFAFFDQCTEFEPCQLPDGTPGFTFFENCYLGSWRLDLAEFLAGADYDPTAPYCFRVGYCPLVIEGEFAKAKTLLYPGFKGTPEHEAIHAAKMPWPEKRQLLELAERLDATLILNPDVTGILKWFNENGVEQIRKKKVKYITTVT